MSVARFISASLSTILLTSTLVLAGGALSGCMTAYKKTVGADATQVLTRTYFTDLNTAWKSVLESLKATPLEVSNRESGYIQTKWTDNTEQKNFTDSFGQADALLKAQYRFRVSVSKAFYNGEPAIKITVQKEQLVQSDVLEGWKPIETDTIDEKTLLYRIGRLISIHMKLARLEEQRLKKAMDAPIN